jgi:integrase/recombinase XerD
MILSRAGEGFLLEKVAAGRSAKTTEQYRYVLDRFEKFLGDVDVEGLGARDIRRFLAWLRTDYKPQRFGGDTSPVSDKTVLNFYTALSSFWSWLVSEGLAEENVVRSLPTPKAPLPVVEPFTKDDITSLIKACDKTREWRTPDGSVTRSRRPTARRDKAIVLTLLDTGLRASELCNLLRKDVDLNNGSVVVRKGKGGVGRVVYLGRRARRVLWRYLAEREEDDPDEFLFLTQRRRPLTPNQLLQRVKRLGGRAGVEGVHPHRFRHTFAIQYLRNGGDVFTLQRLLGHSSLAMVKRYLRLVRDDLKSMHGRASPADNWRL